MADRYIETPDQYEINQSVLNKTKGDKYIMVLSLPEAFRSRKSKSRDNEKIDFDNLQFTITGSPVPDIVVPAIGQTYAGQTLKISSHTRQPYENIFVKFKIDSLFRNWWAIYKWLDLLNDERLAFYNYKEVAQQEAWNALKDYATTFTVYGLDEYNNKVIRFDYEGCFPVSLQSPKYSEETPDDIESQFEFAFTFFKATLV